MPGVLTTNTRCYKPGRVAGGIIGRLSTAAVTLNRVQPITTANAHVAFPYRSVTSVAVVETVETEDGPDVGCYKYADSRRVTDCVLRVGFCPGENPAALELMGLRTPIVANRTDIPAAVYPTGTIVGDQPYPTGGSCSPCGSNLTNPTWAAFWVCNDPDGSNASNPWQVLAFPLAYWRPVDGDNEITYTTDGAPDAVEYEAALYPNPNWFMTTDAAGTPNTGPQTPWANSALGVRRLYPNATGLDVCWGRWVTDIAPPPLPAGSTCDQACGYYTFV